MSSRYWAIALSALLLLNACESGTRVSPREEFIADPVAEADFGTFIHTHEAGLREALAKLGYREDSDTPMLDASVAKLPVADVKSGIASASLGVWVTSPEFDHATPEFIALEFVRPGADEGWYLLTDKGYLYDLLPAGETGSASDLPLALHVAVRNVFPATLEVEEWWRRQDALRTRAGIAVSGGRRAGENALS